MSSADFTKQAAIGTMTRGPVERPPADPIAEALEARRQMAGYHMLDQAASESSAAATRAETERIKAEAEQRQAQAEAQGGGAVSEQLKFLYHQLETLQERYDEARAAQNEAVTAALNERMVMLQEELKEARKGAAADPLGMAIHTIDQTTTLMDKLRPPMPEVQRFPAVDVALEKWKLATEFEREKMRLDYQERAASKAAELALQREVKQAEIEAINRKAEMEQRFFTDTVPKIMDMGQRILTAITQGGGAAQAAAGRSPRPFPQCSACRPCPRRRG